RFSVKLPKALTHERRLADVGAVLDRFLAEATNLGDRLGPFLAQLPPSLAFAPDVAERFLVTIRERFDRELVLEPRHPSWFEPAVERLMIRYRVARVAADPAVVPAASVPGGWNGLVYYRLHGSPSVYRSSYSDEYLEVLAKKLIRATRSAAVW